jgi:undecaprenyl-diphosphatase
LAETARDVTSLGSYTILVTIIVLVLTYLMLVQRRFEALHVGLAVVSGAVLSNILKISFNRPRPVFEQAPEVFTARFPSGHATMSAVVFLTLGAMLALHEPQRSLKVLYLATSVVLTLVVGLTRMYLGVHYPTDVIAGWCLGTGWAILWVLAAYAVNRRFAAQDGETLDRKTL